MSTLSEELAILSNPTPCFVDPEDVGDEGAKLVGKDFLLDDGAILQPSKLRKHTAALLADSDVKYSGKRVSRKSLITSEDSPIDETAVDALQKCMEDDSVDESDDDDDGDSESDDALLETFHSKVNTSVGGQKEFTFDDDGDYEKYGDSFDNDEGDDDEEGDDEDNDDNDEADETMNKGNVDDEGIKRFSKSNESEEVQKGKCALSQLALWDNLLEERIKLQKVISVVNRLPAPSNWRMFEEQGGDNFKNAVGDAQRVLKTLLDKLIEVQTLLLWKHPETKHVVYGTHPELEKDKKEEDPSDEEITSESETESPPQQKPTDSQDSLKRKFKMADYPEFLSKRHKSFESYRNETINKWNDKTRLASGVVKGKSFNAMEQSALQQIQQILRDRDRLIRRTQMNRSSLRVLGVVEKVEDEIIALTGDIVEVKGKKNSADEECDPEVFDDSDFYHHLLRELIERKTSDLNDPIAISKQWIEIEKLRSKIKKRKVDTRASKGRKLRYDVRPKLINFMAPIDTSEWTDESKTDLFKSLFGAQNKDNTSIVEDR